MEPILVIDREGMTYKGQRINDIGLAYAAFMQTMELMLQQASRPEKTEP